MYTYHSIYIRAEKSIMYSFMYIYTYKMRIIIIYTQLLYIYIRS